MLHKNKECAAWFTNDETKQVALGVENQLMSVSRLFLDVISHPDSMVLLALDVPRHLRIRVWGAKVLHRVQNNWTVHFQIYVMHVVSWFEIKAKCNIKSCTIYVYLIYNLLNKDGSWIYSRSHWVHLFIGRSPNFRPIFTGHLPGGARWKLVEWQCKVKIGRVTMQGGREDAGRLAYGLRPMNRCTPWLPGSSIKPPDWAPCGALNHVIWYPRLLYLCCVVHWELTKKTWGAVWGPCGARTGLYGAPCALPGLSTAERSDQTPGELGTAK